ncbi:MAG: tetratricopeptide repeat protein [Zoogloeaceae bacterium]|jgi:tetratricopeptide (TPR) repeat protein|nr:tetratricopeptide repeat protein [Zoogloeaceae bacterium]
MSDSKKRPASGKRRGGLLHVWTALVCLAGGLAAAQAQENAPRASPQMAVPAISMETSTYRMEKARESQIRELVQKIDTATRQGNFTLAETLLGALGRFLPEQSLTMLRMRAWLAVSSGQEETARQTYRQILERIENDENAGINLIILAARAGQEEEAARMLADMVRRHPDSPQLNALRQAFEGTRQ